MRRLALLLAIVASISLPVAAQNTDIESLSGLQFNFGNPGARSLGMGGAFIGLADDASAAEANPAGLTILRKPEISIEGRNYAEQQILTTSGTFPDLERTAFTHHSDRVQVAFASAVLPIKNMFTVGLYYHEPLNNSGAGFVLPQFNDINPNQLDADVPQFYFPAEGFGEPRPVSLEECIAIIQQANNPQACTQQGLLPYVSALDVRQRTFGVAGAWQLHPKFSIGATARYQVFTEESVTVRFAEDPDTGAFNISSILAQVTGTPDGAGDFDLEEETDVTFAAGFKWSPHEKFSIGGVYKKGPTFLAPTYLNTENTGGEFAELGATKFHMPDSAGVGISFRPIPVLTINVDAVNVQYSNLVDDFVSSSLAVRNLPETPYEAKDVTEIHVGGEYFFSTKIPFAIRAGYWRDPAHALTYKGPINNTELVAEAIIYPGGEDQNHYSIGGGLAWPSFQIDFAYDTSDTYKVGSISLVSRF
jgi:long-chain fatty acid transport protein